MTAEKYDEEIKAIARIVLSCAETLARERYLIASPLLLEVWREATCSLLRYGVQHPAYLKNQVDQISRGARRTRVFRA